MPEKPKPDVRLRPAPVPIPDARDLVHLAENGFLVSDGIAHKLESPGIGAHYRVLLSVARADA